MQPQKRLSIGELSKLSGVHIKSLRYYDQIGILKPDYVDPDTNYRYYTHTQLSIVEAISICIELGIPLREFSKYIGDHGKKIDYAKLMADGKALAEKKMRTIRAGIRMIGYIQSDIARCEHLLQHKNPILLDIQKKRFFSTPIEAGWTDEDYYDRLDFLMTRTVSMGYKVGFEYGLLHIISPGKETERYLFLEIISGPASKHIKVLPAGPYWTTCIERSRIESVFEEFAGILDPQQTIIAIEAEIFAGKFNVEQPLYELRCITGHFP